MRVQANSLFHLFNQGANKQNIFFEDENYYLFLRLFRKYVQPHCRVIEWCLMPNHYHFLVDVTEDGAFMIKVGSIYMSKFANGVRLLQSIYAQKINRRYSRSGPLFRAKAKAKYCENLYDNYRTVLFDYIHNNPVKAGLVSRPEEWPFSSFSDYFAGRKNNLCDYNAASEILGIKRIVSTKLLLTSFKYGFKLIYLKSKIYNRSSDIINLNHILLHNSNLLDYIELS